MSEVHAAIGIEQMKKLPSFLDKRKENFQSLEGSLSGLNGFRILPQPIDETRTSSHYCMGLLLESELVEKRPKIMDRLKRMGIGTSIYYPHPVPHMSYYRDKYQVIDCPNAELISNSIIALPVGPHLKVGDMQTIVDGLAKVLSEIN